MSDPKERSSADREAHLKAYGFEGRRHITYTLPIFRPLRPESSPFQAACYVSFNMTWITIVTFLVCLSFWLQASYANPLPEAEKYNLDRIFNTPGLGSRAVGLTLSFCMTVFFFLQTAVLWVLLARRERRKAIADHIKRGVMVNKYEEDTDTWDTEKQAPTSNISAVAASMSRGHGGGYGAGSGGGHRGGLGGGLRGSPGGGLGISRSSTPPQYPGPGGSSLGASARTGKASRHAARSSFGSF